MQQLSASTFTEQTISWIRDEENCLFQVCMPALARLNQSYMCHFHVHELFFHAHIADSPARVPGALAGSNAECKFDGEWSAN